MTQTSADQSTPQNPGKPKRGRPPLAKLTVAGESVFASEMPTNGADLMAMWSLPVAAHRAGRLKIQRKRYPTNVMELLGECLVSEYDMGNTAREYGPGDYYLQLARDPQGLWDLHHCKVSIAPEYAAAVGFAVYQAEPAPMLPRISDARALAAAAGALSQDAPLKIGDLAQLLEMMADKTAAAIQRTAPIQPQPVPPPMEVGNMLQVWKALTDMQSAADERAIRLAGRFSGAAEVLDPEPKAGPDWASMLMQALPTLVNAFALKPAASGLPAAPPAPVLAPPTLPEPPMIDIPMKEEEAAPFAGAVAMLRPWAGKVAAMLQTDLEVETIAQDLCDWIPNKMIPQLAALAAMTAERGPMVLGILGAGLATPRGAELIARIAAILAED